MKDKEGKLEFKDAPEIPIEHSRWEILLLARNVFGEQQKERPWIRHQEVEPKIKLHLCEPIVIGDEPPRCICGEEIPGVVMVKYYWVKGIYEGKRAGAKSIPEGANIKL